MHPTSGACWPGNHHRSCFTCMGLHTHTSGNSWDTVVYFDNSALTFVPIAVYATPIVPFGSLLIISGTGTLLNGEMDWVTSVHTASFSCVVMGMQCPIYSDLYPIKLLSCITIASRNIQSFQLGWYRIWLCRINPQRGYMLKLHTGILYTRRSTVFERRELKLGKTSSMHCQGMKFITYSQSLQSY